MRALLLQHGRKGKLYLEDGKRQTVKYYSEKAEPSGSNGSCRCGNAKLAAIRILNQATCLQNMSELGCDRMSLW